MPIRFSPTARAGVLSLRATPNAGLSVTISSFLRGPAGPSGIDSALKKPCIVATTAAVSLIGTQTIDGVLLVAGNRVLVKDQADDTANGIYTVAASNWARSDDSDSSSEWLEGTMVYVTRGDTFKRTLWALTTTGTIAVDSSNMTFTLVTASPTTT